MLEKLQNIFNMANENKETATAVVVVIWEVIRRAWKTAKPASFFHDMGAMVKMGGSFLIQVGEFMSTIFPQRLRDEEQNNIVQ